MSELINIYTKENPSKAIPMDRALFYQEELERARQGLEPTRYIEVVHVYIFNEHGELIVQKRSKEKKHNPKLFDKSVGGHIQHGDSLNLTAMIETIQELKTPSIVFDNEEDFMKVLSVLRTHLTTSALIEYIDTRSLFSQKLIDGKNIPIGNRVHTFFGIYAGLVKNVDRESRGILYYPLEDLIEELAESPTLFTHDLHDAMQIHLKQMQQFLGRVL